MPDDGATAGGPEPDLRHVAEAKQRVRRETVAAVMRLTPARRAMEEELVGAAVQASPEWIRAATVLLYRSVGWEFTTVGLANAAWRAGKRVLFPRLGSGAADRPVTLAPARGWNDFALGPFGIPQPPEPHASVAESEVDLAIVPGVAWTPAGARLGRGGGYYDRLLARLECPTWGIGFDTQVLPHVPVESHDQAVREVWSCRTRHLLDDPL